MIKKFLNNQKGVSLVSLTITVIIILILTGIVLYNVKDNLSVQKLKSMQADIENLRDKISYYYIEHGSIPAKIEYNNITNIKSAGVISDEVDTGKFYIIDLSAIDNLTLTYGKDYDKIKDTQQVDNLEDIYIINEDSHNIFYVKGITLDGEKFYTDYTKDDIDKKAVTLITNNSEENWSPIYDGISMYKDINEDTVMIPKGFRVSRKTGEDTLLKGLVIKNSTTDDRYVWISVPKNIFKTANSDTDYEKIEQDLKVYVSDYTKEGYKDIYYEGCGIYNQEEYNNKKNKMLASIYKNKGFWISQYIMKTETNRTSPSSSDSLPKPVSKSGLNDYNYVTVEQAQNLANGLNIENKTTSLMFGIQWDLMLKYIEKSTANEEENKNILNIYDLSSEIYEWTLEKNINDNENIAVSRGGVFNDNNKYNPYERNSEKILNSSSNIGFRVTLY